MKRIFWKGRQSIAPTTQNNFWYVLNCRTYHRHGHMVLTRTVANSCERWRTVANGCERLRTVANGCEQLRTVADGCGRLGNVCRTQLNPQTPRVKREALLRIREDRWDCKFQKSSSAVNKNRTKMSPASTGQQITQPSISVFCFWRWPRQCWNNTPVIPVIFPLTKAQVPIHRA